MTFTSREAFHAQRKHGSAQPKGGGKQERRLTTQAFKQIGTCHWFHFDPDWYIHMKGFPCSYLGGPTLTFWGGSGGWPHGLPGPRPFFMVERAK